MAPGLPGPIARLSTFTTGIISAAVPVIRAEHDFTWRLSQDDLQRVDDVRTALTNYRKVDNEEFVKLGEKAKPVK